MKTQSLSVPKRFAQFTSAVLLLIACGGANALPYLVGAGTYDATSTGALNLWGFRYTTNSNDTSAALPLDLAGDTPDAGTVSKAISFELAVGTNVFTFDRVRSLTYSPSYYGINLFFNETGVSFNPSQTSPAVIGDLVAAVQTGSGSLFVPAAGTAIPTYGKNETSPVTAPYGGATSFALGIYDISVSGFEVNHNSANLFGSITIEVTQQPTGSAPEPSVLVLLGLGSALLGFSRRPATRGHC